MRNYKKQTGIGLLELMLAMAIIAILIVMSITYFQSSKNKTLLTAGGQEIQSMIGVIAGFTDPAASAGTSKDLTMPVALSGSLPKEYIHSTTTGTGDQAKTSADGISSPWGNAKTYTITYSDDITEVGTGLGTKTEGAVIVGDGLPSYACQGLSDQFVAGQNNIIASDCTNGKLTIKISITNTQDIVPRTAS